MTAAAAWIEGTAYAALLMLIAFDLIDRALDRHAQSFNRHPQGSAHRAGAGGVRHHHGSSM